VGGTPIRASVLTVPCATRSNPRATGQLLSATIPRVQMQLAVSGVGSLRSGAKTIADDGKRSLTIDSERWRWKTIVDDGNPAN
jgi:hypothetical protein